ncbi:MULTISPECIES: hypothetical protein [unclassified Bradyrhizobium]|uniref:hypothetical protein n=1 Tax=unclassified Bradyrhizobium TaxID=2631580 RepID=UPI0024E1094B|nr:MULTISPECIES: hypothetical protein [unclassified Bradyrhizobium]
MSVGLSRLLERKLGATASPAGRRGDAQIPLGAGLIGLLALALMMTVGVGWVVTTVDDGETADASLAQLTVNASRQYQDDEDGTEPSRGFPVVPGVADGTGTASSVPAAGSGSSLMDANASLAPVVQPERTAAPGPAVPSGLRISSQSWRRGGLGSKALVTFTLRNANTFAIKDVEISCAFSRRDGSHVTDRRRVVQGDVRPQGRRTFTAVHVGFVNVNVSTAKCALVAATKI